MMGARLTTAADAHSLEERRRAISAAVSSLGWELGEVELDRERGRLAVTVRRGGRRVVLRVNERGASVERWQADSRTVRVGTRRRDSMLWDVPDERFLGRTRAVGAREALAEFAAYLAANGCGAALPAGALAEIISPGSGTEGGFDG